MAPLCDAPVSAADDLAEADLTLGAAHAVRGAFDESSLDAPAARAQARATLGADAFQARYEEALALARKLVSAA